MAFTFVFVVVLKKMSYEEVWEVAQIGYADEVERLVEEEGVEVDSKNEVSVCVLFACSSWCCFG